MRFLFRHPAVDATGLLGLPWEQPLEQWDPSLLVDVPERGISRHVVRFVADGRHVYALKEIQERLARREYDLLGRFRDEGLPTVSGVGICVDRPRGQEAVLVTRYLENSVPSRWLFSGHGRTHAADQLLDALVELLVRLHLAGVFWGDCSLSNTLLRGDAGALTAYLVDAETSEQHAALSRGQRAHDVDLARERVGAEMLDLRFGGLLLEDVDPIETADSLPRRYASRWEEASRVPRPRNGHARRP
jgi:tRNA A-37 threonylcarbamoyl transferase component Bud32